jgi:hypothetical protein
MQEAQERDSAQNNTYDTIQSATPDTIAQIQ